MEYYTAMKKNVIRPSAATWVHLEVTIPSEVSQTEKKQVSCNITYICSLKNQANETVYKTDRLTDIANKPKVPKKESDWGEG